MMVVREIDQNARERDVVFHDQQDGVTPLDQIAVVVEDQFLRNLMLQRRGENQIDLGLRLARLAIELHRSDLQSLALGHLGRRHVGLRQIQSESAPDAGGALQADFAAQQTGEPRLMESESGTAVSACRTVGLLERFEDNALLIGLNPDAAIDDRERYDRFRAGEDVVAQAPSHWSPYRW